MFVALAILVLAATATTYADAGAGGLTSGPPQAKGIVHQ